MYYIVYPILYLLSLLPLCVLYFVSDYLIYPFVRLFYRKSVVEENLKGSFPDKSNKELADIERRFYHFFADMLVEDLKAMSISEEEMMRRTTFSGIDYIESQFSEGKKIMFCYLGHYGNWEWLATYGYWMPFAHCTQIYHPLRNKTADRIFLKTRQRSGSECIPMQTTLRRLVALRNEGKSVVVGLIADQLPQWKSIHHFTEFLNRDTAVFTGTEQLARKFGGFVMYAKVTRPKRGYYHCHMSPLSDNPVETEEYYLTDLFMKLLEEDIKGCPHLWLWTHKRWRRTKEQWIERQKGR